jgi:hypothetical protein
LGLKNAHPAPESNGLHKINSTTSGTERDPFLMAIIDPKNCVAEKRSWEQLGNVKARIPPYIVVLDAGKG